MVLCGRSAAGFHVHGPDKLIAATHHARHALVALTFPGFNRIGLVPRVVQLPVLFRQAQTVLFAHVEIRPGDHAANGGAGHDFLRLEIDLGQARTVLTRLHRQPTETEVTAIAVHQAHIFFTYTHCASGLRHKAPVFPRMHGWHLCCCEHGCDSSHVHDQGGVRNADRDRDRQSHCVRR